MSVEVLELAATCQDCRPIDSLPFIFMASESNLAFRHPEHSTATNSADCRDRAYRQLTGKHPLTSRDLHAVRLGGDMKALHAGPDREGGGGGEGSELHTWRLRTQAPKERWKCSTAL
jgi:hypothetical protein